MTQNTKMVKDLILFYVKENYTNYLQTKNIKMIPEDDIQQVVEQIYTDRKPHLKEFLKSSLKVFTI